MSVNVLVIDDSRGKRENLVKAIQSLLPRANVDEADCFSSAMKKLSTSDFEVTLLDMTLPSFNGRVGEAGRLRLLGGSEILDEMEFAGISSKVIVVSQFGEFEDQGKIETLFDLVEKLKVRHPKLCIGGIHYEAHKNKWTAVLADMLATLGY